MVRKAYTTEELRAAGFGPDPVTSFDEKAKAAEELLKVDTPFGSGIRKWQLPVNMIEMRVYETVFLRIPLLSRTFTQSIQSMIPAEAFE